MSSSPSSSSSPTTPSAPNASADLSSLFTECSAFVSGRLPPSVKVSDSIKLRLYGLFKQSTVGANTTPKPSLFDFVGKSKWNSWNDLGPMTKQEAMHMYISTVDSLYSKWREEICHPSEPSNPRPPADKSNQADDFNSPIDLADDAPEGPAATASSSSNSSSPFGPLQSRPMMLDAHPSSSTSGFSSTDEEQIPVPSSIHSVDGLIYYASKDDINAIIKEITSGESKLSINDVDSTGRGVLHILADRGYVEGIKTIMNIFHKVIDINIQDEDGMTPLHYATVTEREQIVNELISRGANQDIIDNDGQKPDLSFME